MTVAELEDALSEYKRELDVVLGNVHGRVSYTALTVEYRNGTLVIRPKTAEEVRES